MAGTGVVGRPTTYTPEVAAMICERIAEGESLRAICREEESPGLATVFQWLIKHKEFAEQYAIAREAQADAMFDEVLDIARQEPRMVTIESEGGSIRTVVDSGDVQHRRLEIDALKWAAGKMRPKKYGDSTTLQAEVTHKHYVAALPPPTALPDPAAWAREVQAERVRNGEITEGPAKLPAPQEPRP